MDCVIKNHSNEQIDYAFEAGHGDAKASWIVVLGHGVTGNKDRPIVADVAKGLNEVGFDTLRFSFSGNGESAGDFRESTISKELSDLDAVLSAVSGQYARVCYVGHSMGGAVGVLRAAEDPRISALISLAGMVDTKAFATVEFGEEKPDEGLMWEEEECPLSSAFMDDLCKSIVSCAPQAEKITVPWLLLHGTADDVVLPKDTEFVKGLQKANVETLFVEGADHSFNEPEHKAALVKKVQSWMSDQAS